MVGSLGIKRFIDNCRLCVHAFCFAGRTCNQISKPIWGQPQVPVKVRNELCETNWLKDSRCRKPTVTPDLSTTPQRGMFPPNSGGPESSKTLHSPPPPQERVAQKTVVAMDPDARGFSILSHRSPGAFFCERTRLELVHAAPNAHELAQGVDVLRLDPNERRSTLSAKWSDKLVPNFGCTSGSDFQQEKKNCSGHQGGSGPPLLRWAQLLQVHGQVKPIASAAFWFPCQGQWVVLHEYRPTLAPRFGLSDLPGNPSARE